MESHVGCDRHVGWKAMLDGMLDGMLDMLDEDIRGEGLPGKGFRLFLLALH